MLMTSQCSYTRHNKTDFTDLLTFILIDEPCIRIYNSISNALKYTHILSNTEQFNAHVKIMSSL